MPLRLLEYAARTTIIVLRLRMVTGHALQLTLTNCFRSESALSRRLCAETLQMLSSQMSEIWTRLTWPSMQVMSVWSRPEPNAVYLPLNLRAPTLIPFKSTQLSTMMMTSIHIRRHPTLLSLRGRRYQFRRIPRDPPWAPRTRIPLLNSKSRASITARLFIQATLLMECTLWPKWIL